MKMKYNLTLSQPKETFKKERDFWGEYSLSMSIKSEKANDRSSRQDLRCKKSVLKSCNKPQPANLTKTSFLICLNLSQHVLYLPELKVTPITLYFFSLF